MGPVSEAAEGTLNGVLREFEARVRGDEKYYDSRTSWMAAAIVCGDEVSGLELDLNEWGEIETYHHDSDWDLVDDEEDPEIEEGQPTSDEERPAPRSRQNGPRKQPGGGKLRPAADVMSRLRWDDNMDSNDFVIGYEDRFAGIKEKGLGEWRSEQTDEEFIPQHRIAYFKRRSDGVVLWDRAARVDLIFGSG